MAWKEIEDEPDHYEVTVTADYPDLTYPVRTDVTLRRLQKFKPAINDRLSIHVGGRWTNAYTRDAQGRITIRGVEIPSKAGTRITVHQGK